MSKLHRIAGQIFWLDGSFFVFPVLSSWTLLYRAVGSPSAPITGRISSRCTSGILRLNSSVAEQLLGFFLSVLFQFWCITALFKAVKANDEAGAEGIPKGWSRNRPNFVGAGAGAAQRSDGSATLVMRIIVRFQMLNCSICSMRAMEKENKG